MNHQYESEILFRLMERDGFNIPSSVPPYEAEIKDYFINQVKEGYPKLMDYEAEWLLYNETEHLPAEFPIETVQNVTKATFENVVPYEYQSAILNGNTKYRDIDTGDILDTFDETKNLELVSVKMPVLTTYNQGNLFKNYVQDGSQWGKDYNCASMDVKYSQNGSYVKLKSKNSLCYTGFVSPSLSQGTYKFTCKIKVGSVGDSYRILIHGNPNGAKNDNRGFASDKIVSTQENETFEYVGYFNEANKMLFYAYRNGQEIEYYDIIFTKLSDEDVTNDIEKYNYKTNILMVNEPIELRGIGAVKDTVDCLTGELTQRIREVVLDGTEEWKTSINSVGVKRYVLNGIGNDLNNDGTNTSALICDKFKSCVNSWVEQNDCVQIVKSSGIYIIDNSVDSLDAFVNKLKATNIKIQYQVATESVKTVDLKTVNETGESVHFMPLEGTMHVQSSGEPIQPTFDMSVPVEATTQNLASFIDLEMEE